MLDGIINLELADVLASGNGRIHGVDSSVSMIASANKAASANPAAAKTCTFEGEFLVSPYTFASMMSMVK